MSCAKTVIRANLSKELNCTIQGFDRFFDTHLDLKECSNQHEGAEASKKYQAIILGLYHNSSLYGCKHPCERNTYTANINTYHFNSIIWDGFPPSLADESYYHLFFYYKSDIVQKQVEVLVYDFGGSRWWEPRTLSWIFLLINFVYNHALDKNSFWLDQNFLEQLEYKFIQKLLSII